MEWVAISFPRGSSQPRDQTHVSCIAGRYLTTEPPGKPQTSIIHHETIQYTQTSTTHITPFPVLDTTHPSRLTVSLPCYTCNHIQVSCLPLGLKPTNMLWKVLWRHSSKFSLYSPLAPKTLSSHWSQETMPPGVSGPNRKESTWFPLGFWTKHLPQQQACILHLSTSFWHPLGLFEELSS